MKILDHPVSCRPSAPSAYSIAGWFLLFVAACVSTGWATDVKFSNGGYSFTSSSVTLNMYGIENYSSTPSGALRIELWAFTSPYVPTPGAITTGYKLAESPSLGSLGADSVFTASPVTATVSFLSPPNGTYYLTMFLDEYMDGSYDDGFEAVDSVNFTETMTFNATGAAFGVSSAVPVGYGYYYDTDLDYIYSFGNGFIYLSDLNRYYYIDPGTDFTTGTYIYDFYRSSWTYADKSFWPYVYYYNGTGWVDTGFN